MRKFLFFLAWPLIGGPYLITYIGVALNQAAIAANQGTMPILLKNCADRIGNDEVHVCMTTATHMKILCDWINLHVAILSPGDVLLNIGDAITAPCFWAWISLAVFALYKLTVTPAK